ncbi:MAG: NUDIX domain-containing protein [Candidatus Magasanikbacteria bacterium]|nr:NUDIX domain-containing protein [Candidatus Magasanikbacteria bacterium]
MQSITIRLRIITIQDNKVLLTYDSKNDFYFYVGGRLEYGETVHEGAIREIKEECGVNTKFTFQKILYIRDFIDKDSDEHSLELFILGDIATPDDLEGYKDPEFGGEKWLE